MRTDGIAGEHLAHPLVPQSEVVNGWCSDPDLTLGVTAAGSATTSSRLTYMR